MFDAENGDLVGVLIGGGEDASFVEQGLDRGDVVEADDEHLVSGWMPVDEFCEKLGIPRDEDGSYETVAGLVINHLRRLPALGDTFVLHGWRFEVIDLDDRRIDKLIVSRV